MKKIKIAVIGAGVSGVTFAHFYSTMGGEVSVFEREKEVGGLSRTIEIDGFSFDWTGHWLHLKDGPCKDWITSLPGLSLISTKRKATIFFKGRYMPYPFQSHLAWLDKKDLDECAQGFYDRKSGDESSFEAVLRSRFGSGIYSEFLAPYNQKVWGVLPGEMSGQYALKYLPQPNEEQIVDGILTKRVLSAGYNAGFYYPSKGGMGKLAEVILDSGSKFQLNLDSKVTKIDWKNRTLIFDCKESVEYEKLIITSSLADFGKMGVNLPSNVQSAVSKLRGRRVQFLDLGIVSKEKHDFHWSYIPQVNSPVYRVGIYSNVVKYMAPKGCSSLYVELSGSKIYKTTKEALDDSMPTLLKMSLIEKPQDVKVSNLRVIEDAYAIPNHDYEFCKSEIFSFMELNDIYPLGRFGSWVYSSMGEDMESAMNLAFSMEI
jgi:protoporphyrinogen oxidase